MRRRFSRFGIALGLSGAGLVFAPAFAADNTFAPSIETGGTYNSNLRLLPSSLDNEVAGGYLDAELEFGSRTERTTFTFTPRLHATRYWQGSEENTTDWIVTSALSHRTLRSTYGVDIDASQQDVVNSELLAPGDGSLGQPGSGDGGVAQIRNTVLDLSIAPHATIGVGERSSLLLGAGYSDISYDREVLGVQVDYTHATAMLGWSLRTSERFHWSLSGNSARFDPDNDGLATDTYGAQVELWREQTERLRSYFRIGAQRAKTDAPQGSTAGTQTHDDVILGLGLERRLATGHALLQLTHSMEPSGVGELLERSEGYIELGRQVTPKTLFSFGGRIVWTETVNADALYPDQRYFIVSARLDWRLRRTLSLAAQADYTNQAYDGSADRDSTGARLGLVYAPNRRD